MSSVRTNGPLQWWAEWEEFHLKAPHSKARPLSRSVRFCTFSHTITPMELVQKKNIMTHWEYEKKARPLIPCRQFTNFVKELSPCRKVRQQTYLDICSASSCNNSTTAERRTALLFIKILLYTSFWLLKSRKTRKSKSKTWIIFSQSTSPPFPFILTESFSRTGLVVLSFAEIQSDCQNKHNVHSLATYLVHLASSLQGLTTFCFQSFLFFMA